jgi:hypothetical protein
MKGKDLPDTVGKRAEQDYLLVSSMNIYLTFSTSMFDVTTMMA